MAQTGTCEDKLIPQIRKNPLLKTSGLPREAVPYDQIRTDHFRPAFTRALRMAKIRLEQLRKSEEAATFENTIIALSEIGGPLDHVNSVFSHYLSVNTNPTLEALAEKINPELTRFSNSINFDPAIFSRVEALYEKRSELNLTPEQNRLLEKTYRSFLRNGAKLTQAEKKRVGQIDERLSVLGEQFKVNVNQVINSYELVVTDSKELAGLPQSAIDAAAELAKKKEKPGTWIFTLQAPSYLPVMDYAESSKLREQMWRARANLAASGEHDNRLVLLEIAKLRQERAGLLGYETHAQFVTEERMAKNPETVKTFLNRLADVYLSAAKNELQELKEFAGKEVMPWDLSFYSEKLKEARYSYSEEELRPYFPVDQVVKGAFFAAEKLYGIQFAPRPDLPVWHPSVTAYELKDSAGRFLSLFYLDPFPRDSKRPGAWMDSLKPGGEFEGELRRPHVVNVGNFTPPVGEKPALLTLDEVKTVFHELGHGLHGMLSQAHYQEFFGTNVFWDFVELPSQLFERWATAPEVLDVYARHHETGERIPNELIEKVKRAENFQAGMLGLGQLRYGMLDMAWYGSDVSRLKSAEEVVEWEKQALDAFELLRVQGAERVVSTSFSHIFAGGYAAGYYSYKWADFLAADAAAYFKAQGMFNPEVAAKYRSEIMEKGGTEDPDILYRRFRGQDPDPDALLKSEGLLQHR